MLTHPTLEQMHELGLRGMARAFQDLQANPDAAALTHADWLALLLDREAADRRDRRLKTRLRSAKLRFTQACVEDVDHRAPRGLDRALFQQLAGGAWITQHENLLITGPSGVGKSWLACALAQRACRDNVTVLYKRLPRLFPELAMGRGDGRHERLMRAMAKASLLILDDWGPEPLTAVQRREILEILEDRYGLGATIVTSQLPVEQWHDVVGDPTLADAILDRLVHNAHRLELKGASMRKRMAAKAEAETP